MKQQLKEFVTSLDVLNTVHGGVSEPYISLQEKKETREVHVRVPGVSREGIQAEIVNNNQLAVYYLIPVVSSGKTMHLPRVVYHDVVPDFIDVRNIRTEWEENEFIVRLPFTSMPDGNHHKVER